MILNKGDNMHTGWPVLDRVPQVACKDKSYYLEEINGISAWIGDLDNITKNLVTLKLLLYLSLVILTFTLLTCI